MIRSYNMASFLPNKPHRQAGRQNFYDFFISISILPFGMASHCLIQLGKDVVQVIEFINLIIPDIRYHATITSVACSFGHHGVKKMRRL